MRVFMTGATGFGGSYLVAELINAGHQVVGLSRSEAGTETLTRAGAEVVQGDVNQLARDKVKMPVESIMPGEARAYFGPLAELVSIDLAAAGELTRKQLGWMPTGPDLPTDLRNME